MTNYSKRSADEATTYELFDASCIDANHADWQNRRIIATVFKAMWSYSMPVEKIERIACAMLNLESVDLQETLTTLTRKRILRSYMDHGVRLYEVNY
jgi:hypothetical protein